MPITFLLDLGLSLADLLHVLYALLLFVLLIDLTQLGQSLYHGVYLLLLGIHEHLLEWSLCRESEGLKQVGLATGVLCQLVVEGLHLLLGFEGQLLRDLLGHVYRCKHPFLPLSVDVLFMHYVL